MYRQQAVSKIKLLASEVQQKLAITLKPSSPQTSIDLQQSDCYLYAEKGAAACRRLLKVLLQEKLPALGIRECKVLIPQYKGDLGIDQINPYLQELLNPAYQHKAEWDRWGTNFRQDDPVIWLKNEQDQLVNGSELLIHSLALQDDPPTVTFSLDDQLITRPTEETYIALAYALSVHKSQGSEYEAVILLLQPEHRYSFNQRLLYTAITRAARLLIIIGSTDLLESASHNQKQLIRRTSIVRWWQQAQYLP